RKTPHRTAPPRSGVVSRRVHSRRSRAAARLNAERRGEPHGRRGGGGGLHPKVPLDLVEALSHVQQDVVLLSLLLPLPDEIHRLVRGQLDEVASLSLAEG